jgi:hypothetical protein
VTPRVWIEEQAASASGEALWRLLVYRDAAMDDSGPYFVTALVTTFLGTSSWISRWLLTEEMESDPELRERPLRFHVEVPPHGAPADARAREAAPRGIGAHPALTSLSQRSVVGSRSSSALGRSTFVEP